MTSFPSITSILVWADDNTGLKYLDNDNYLPYIQKNNLWHYFSRNPEQGAKGMYHLVMTSNMDLQEKRT